MKILKRYILELCFILSFALPFIKGANADNGRRFVEIYYGFTFLIVHAIVTAVFICSLLIACLLKKRWTTSLEILTQTYQLGFYLNILLGILLIIKYLKVKQ